MGQKRKNDKPLSKRAMNKQRRSNLKSKPNIQRGEDGDAISSSSSAIKTHSEGSESQIEEEDEEEFQTNDNDET